MPEEICVGRMPDWEEDGEHVVYVSGRYDLFRVGVTNPADIEQLTFFNSAGSDVRQYYPRVSPDGTKIAFVHWRPHYGINVWVMDADGGNLRQITSDGVLYASIISWSPSGEEITYAHYKMDDWTYGNGVLWSINVATGERRQLTANGMPLR